MSANGKRGPLLLLIAYLGFMSLGLRDAILGVAWPSVRDTFALPQSALGAVFVATAIGYSTSSFFAGHLAGLMGLAPLLVGSSALAMTSLAGQAVTPFWFLFVGCALLAGLGAGGIDSSLNAYGASHFSPGHLNWMHAFFGIGAMAGPLIMTAVLTGGWSWRWGYAAIGILLLFMTAAFACTRERWGSHDDTRETATLKKVGMLAALGRTLVWLQIGLFFLYTGLEVTVGQWGFTLLTESRGLEVGAAGLLVGSYWGSLAAGRVLFGFLLGRLRVLPVLRFSMGGVLLGALVLALCPYAPASFAGLLIIGLSQAPIFPCLMAETPRRLGTSYAAHAVGFQVSAAVVGAAVVPSLAGVLAEHHSLEAIPLVVTAVAVVQLGLHELLLKLQKPNTRERTRAVELTR